MPSYGKHNLIDAFIDIFISALVKEAFTFLDSKHIDSISLVKLLSCCKWISMNSIESDLEGANKNLM